MIKLFKNMWDIFKDDNEWNEKNVIGCFGIAGIEKFVKK